jgi:hypothetical protein
VTGLPSPRLPEPAPAPVLDLEPGLGVEEERELRAVPELELAGVPERELVGVREREEEEGGEVGCDPPTWLRPNTGRTRGLRGRCTSLLAWRRCSPPETRPWSGSLVTEVSCRLR